MLQTGARRRRLAATALVAALLLAGAVWGSDDWFPFGPQSQFAWASGPDQPAPDTRVEGVDIRGVVVDLGEATTGIRRAEIEGHEATFRADPARLADIARAYARRNPGAAALVLVRLVIRWREISGGRPTGGWHDEVVAAWSLG